MGKSEGRGGGHQGKKSGQGERTVQRHKFYKFEGGRGGRGGKSAVPGRGSKINDGSVGEESGEPEKVFLLDKYRLKPLPEMLSAPGILISTTKDRERAAELELIQYLETVAEEVYPEAAVSQDDNDLDFEELLKRDLEAMKDDSTKSERFRLCLREGFCLLYVNVLPPLDPYKLVKHIMIQADATGKYPLKHCKRLIPISATTKATLRQLSETSATVIRPAFQSPDDKAFKFAVDINSRHTDKSNRVEMIHAVAAEVTKLEGGHVVDLKNPEKTIIVEVCKNNLGVVVIDDFERYKKYNPGAVATQAAQRTHSGVPSQADDLHVRANTPIQPSVESRVSKAETKEENRQRRAAAIAQSHATPSPPHEAVKNMEDGEWKGEEKDVEKGEIVEDEDVELGAAWEEVIEDGKVVRYPKNAV